MRDSYAEKTIEILKKQVIRDFGAKPLEYIPLAAIRAELDTLIKAANEGRPYDEERMDHLIRCMECNDEYIAEKKEEDRKWEQESREFLVRSLDVMRSFIPVNISLCSQQDLEKAGLSKALCKRMLSKRCLWLIRMNKSDIAKMHFADLSGKYGAEAQNLDLVEMAAIYYWYTGINFESDVGGKKSKLCDGLKRALKEKMGKEFVVEELMKKRNIAYKNQTGPFNQGDDVFIRETISSHDVFTPGASLRDLQLTLAAKSEYQPSAKEGKDISLSDEAVSSPRQLQESSLMKHDFKAARSNIESLFGSEKTKPLSPSSRNVEIHRTTDFTFVKENPMLLRPRGFPATRKAVDTLASLRALREVSTTKPLAPQDLSLILEDTSMDVELSNETSASASNKEMLAGVPNDRGTRKSSEIIVDDRLGVPLYFGKAFAAEDIDPLRNDIEILEQLKHGHKIDAMADSNGEQFPHEWAKAASESCEKRDTSPEDMFVGAPAKNTITKHRSHDKSKDALAPMTRINDILFSSKILQTALDQICNHEASSSTLQIVASNERVVGEGTLL
jgi:hypothetical protein